MVNSTKIVIGTLLVILLASGVVYVSLEKVRVRVDEDKSTLYVKNENNRWVVAGREYNKLFDGSHLLYRDKKNVKVKTVVDDINQTVLIERRTPFIRGPVIVDTYFFDGRLDDVRLFPIRHTVEVFNGSGFFYRYEVRNLDYDGSTTKLDGDETLLGFGRNVYVRLHPGYRWAWVYASGVLKAQYDILSDYEVFSVRLFDPSTSFTTEQVESLSLTPLSNTTFAVAWCDEASDDITFQVWNTTGSNLTNPIDVDTDSGGCTFNRVGIGSFDDNNMLVAWRDGTKTDPDLFKINISVVNSSGSVLCYSDEKVDDASISCNVDVSCANSERCSVAWYSSNSDDMLFKTYNSSCVNLTGKVSVDIRSNWGRVVAVSAGSNNKLVIGFFDRHTNDTSVAEYYDNGTEITAQFDADSNVGMTSYGVDVAWVNETVYAVAYVDADENDITVMTFKNGTTTPLHTFDVDSNVGDSAWLSATVFKPVSIAITNSSAAEFAVSWYQNITNSQPFVICNLSSNITSPVNSSSIGVSWQSSVGYLQGVDIGFCDGCWVHAFTETTSQSNFSTYKADGSSWDGTCEEEAPPIDNYPTVVLNTPVEGANLTSSSISFNVTVTDDNLVQNVTLYLNNSANETNTSHFNGTYIFTKTLTDGNWNWSILAFDNNTQSNQSSTRTFIVNTTTSICVYGGSGDFECNCTAYDTIESNYDIGDNNFILFGDGSIELQSNLTSVNNTIINEPCLMAITQGGGIS